MRNTTGQKTFQMSNQVSTPAVMFSSVTGSLCHEKC